MINTDNKKADPILIIELQVCKFHKRQHQTKDRAIDGTKKPIHDNGNNFSIALIIEYENKMDKT